jgi:hypothetical protein
MACRSRLLLLAALFAALLDAAHAWGARELCAFSSRSPLGVGSPRRLVASESTAGASRIRVPHRGVLLRSIDAKTGNLVEFAGKNGEVCTRVGNYQAANEVESNGA